MITINRSLRVPTISEIPLAIGVILRRSAKPKRRRWFTRLRRRNRGDAR
jgi:hypothetical protein